ncbi:MAG: tetratricopeptide repeat protein [Bacteroidaceae bacterium]|nr:tetratricopeptide repeat protein [Bacteroidaceae bacterium]
MTKTKENIKRLISDGNLQDAISQLDGLIGESCKDDELYYLRGNAYRKLCNWQLALNNYLEAISLNPESPAAEAHRMLMEILEFYNKDMYNQ